VLTGLPTLLSTPRGLSTALALVNLMTPGQWQCVRVWPNSVEVPYFSQKIAKRNVICKLYWLYNKGSEFVWCWNLWNQSPFKGVMVRRFYRNESAWVQNPAGEQSYSKKQTYWFVQHLEPQACDGNDSVVDPSHMRSVKNNHCSRSVLSNVVDLVLDPHTSLLGTLPDPHCLDKSILYSLHHK
jgi:hypothetical protein